MDAAEPPLVAAARPSHGLRSKPSTKRRKAPPLKTIQTASQGAGAKGDNAGRKHLPRDVLDAKQTSPPKPSTKVMRKPSTTGRPIVPFTEQKSLDRTLSKGKRDEESDRWDVAPDGASAGRTGRQFTVANVGNNGKLYLRPSVRRANKRYPQPNFTFPITPPGTAGLEGVYPENLDEPSNSAADRHDNQFTPTPRTSIIPNNYAPDTSVLASATAHRRAVSDGTIRDFNSPTGTDTDGYRIVITKPTHGDDHRPKTTDHLDDLDADGVPLLNINIPSWKLGTPRFSTRGTPMFRGSSYAPTDEFRSASRSSMYHSSDRSIGVPLRGLRSRRPSHLVIPQLRFPRTSHASSQASIRQPRAVPSTYASNHLVIGPDMFDELTFKPACDDRLIVRYSPSGSVTAATPSRLVAEITSPSFLDYELISDFFLTFRAFLEPETLLRMLMARLRWALERTDEVGMIVRVRTFVAMRHWILNYFVDDFVLDYDLRLLFCILLNDFVDELSQDAKERRVQLKILTELKKCWRRICAHYWDGPNFADSLGPQVPVAPGGIAGYRDPNLDPTFWEREGVDPPQWHAVSAIANDLGDETYPSDDVPGTTNFEDFLVLEDRPGTPEHQIITTPMLSNGPASPLSIASMDIVSCSFPSKNVRALNPNSSQPLAAHPVYSTSPILPPGAIATTPKALAGKRVRPAQSHRRNNSTTDSLREHGSDHSISHDVDLHTILQSAGNLVRGNILPPGQPFVDIEADTPTGDRNRQTTIFQPIARNTTKDRIFGGAMSGSGMKKFLGGVRRALNNRGQWSSGSHSSLPAVASVGVHAITMDQLPGTTVIPQAGYGHSTTRPQVRIDLLGAEVAEDFKRAIREEEEAAEAERLGAPRPAPKPASTIRRPMEYSAAHMESSTVDYLGQDRRSRPMSDMGLTTGSQSIVIVDDTAPFDMPGIRDRLPAPAAFNPSVGGLSVGSFLTAGGDPTPPTTPPAQLMAGTPRRSSYLLDQLVGPPSASQESLPPFVPDMATLGGTYSLGPSDDASRYSYSTMRRSSQRHPPVSRGTLQIHKRNQSTNTQKSIYSFRRHASFGSRLERHSTARSFDATTDSSMLDREYQVPVVEPPRVLRRRPGGYLRAVANVGGLDNQPTVRRSQSVGSLTTYTESVRSSFLGTQQEQGDDGDDCSLAGAKAHPRERQEIFSVGQLTEKPPKRHLSLFSTHSSKPIMRPSFEIEARKLAQIPDEDDGGIESALLKLEGRYQPKPRSFERLKQTALIDAEEFGGAAAAADRRINQDQYQESEVYATDHEYPSPQSLDFSQGKGKQPLASQYNRDTLTARSRTVTLEARSFLTGDSDESYCSIPLLDRGLTDDGRSGRGTAQWTDRSVLRGSSDDDDVATSNPAMGDQYDPLQASSHHLSYDFVEKTESIEGIQPGKTAPAPAEDQTFLEDASVGGSDLSSELSPSEAEDVVDTLGKRAAAFSISSQPHPFGDPIATPRSDSSSAPMTLAQALAMSPVMMSPMMMNTERTLDPDQIWSRKPLPLSPEMLQDVSYMSEPKSPEEPPHATEALKSAPQSEIPNTLKYSVHLPFILAFDSDTLAQQFTLIEKDALNDIDWRELIEMNWKNATSNDSRSWVDFLRNTNAHGVEVVVARFNIMVKWAISEIVLTQHIEERARCIIKLIHIAAHCRRYRNFATLAQLTIALSSAEVSRLSKTWDLVPARDLNTLGEMEALVTPTRNFYNLRAEMEGGSDGGCIPFVGIYTHDLLFNAQRASEIASSPTTPPLINFERCRIGAAVVKTLLRLLEASTRYTFQPVEGITERCLWMGALSDDEIRRHSEALE
ncbi:guanine nucleotide exchange factor [Trichoderma arundinaceum]|uniref:Guanine nucleotide exchange factor n=1 Tax=Trichoderma arundinaceum TaxID=490622 RepID=A0A395NRW1_TRIAR|nr:guanine nucleotide exchange factor [Trichoderma arundinaceum]